MTQTGYSNAIVNAMLSWLKGLARWVLRLFNLSGGVSPLKFMANNWKGLLIFFLILGLAADLIIWLIRWRPYWVWFKKKRVIINDRNFFEGEEYFDESDDKTNGRRENRRRKADWQDDDFVVRSKTIRSRSASEGKKAVKRGKKETAKRTAEHKDVFRDDMFSVNANQKFSDKYEDEVFNVSSLPDANGETETPAEVRRSDIRNVVKHVSPRERASGRPRARR